MSSSSLLQNVRDTLGVPLPTARRRNASCVECLRNLPERPRAGLLCLADDRQHISRLAIRLGLHGAHRAFAGFVEPRVTEGNPTGLCGRQGLTGPRGDERTFLLSQRGE